MTIEIKRHADEITIEVVGRLDTTTAPALDKTISEDVADTQRLTLDLQGLEYISSAGLRVLLSAQKKLQKNGALTVKNVRTEVMEILEMTGFADILTIE